RSRRSGTTPSFRARSPSRFGRPRTCSSLADERKVDVSDDAADAHRRRRQARREEIRMKRLATAIVAMALLGVACTSGGGGASSAPSSVATIDPSGSHAPVTLTVWDYFSERE